MRDALNRLSEFQTIDREEARTLLEGIAQGEYDPLLVASFLTVFRMRSITTDELLGFRDAMLSLALKVDFGETPTVDLCGTGGDGKDTFNISTLASFVAAGAGVKVTKHGNVSVSSRCGSSDVLQELGVTFTNDNELLAKQLAEANICYLHAPLFHPAMKNIAPIRKALGVKTFFNLLGPLVNPARPKAQMIGVFSLEIAKLFHRSLSCEKRPYAILHSLDGYDEVSLTGEWHHFGLESDERCHPEQYGLPQINASAISGGDKLEASQLFSQILSGNGTKEQQSVVITNAAYAIMLSSELEHGLGKLSFREATELAKSSLEQGRAKKSFEVLKQLSSEEKRK